LPSIGSARAPRVANLGDVGVSPSSAHGQPHRRRFIRMLQKQRIGPMASIKT
jgi:hypothetical protein